MFNFFIVISMLFRDYHPIADSFVCLFTFSGKFLVDDRNLGVSAYKKRRVGGSDPKEFWKALTFTFSTCINLRACVCVCSFSAKVNINKRHTRIYNKMAGSSLYRSSSGHYLFIESSSPRVLNDTACLFSPVYGPPEASAEADEGVYFSFWFHLYGSTTGKCHRTSSLII